MYAREGHTFGDTWYFVRGEEAHLFCLTKPEGSSHGVGHRPPGQPRSAHLDETGVHITVSGSG